MKILQISLLFVLAIAVVSVSGNIAARRVILVQDEMIKDLSKELRETRRQLFNVSKREFESTRKQIEQMVEDDRRKLDELDIDSLRSGDRPKDN